MTTAWDEVRGLIEDGDAGKLIDRLVTLDDRGRKLVAGELRGHIPVLRERVETRQRERWLAAERRRPGRRGRYVPEHEPWEDWAEMTRLAGAGTLSAVTAVTAWVNRRDLMTAPMAFRGTGFGDPEPVVRLLAHRPAEWQAELAGRLAARLRGRRDAGTPLALAMLRHTGVEPPSHDPLVVAWVTAGIWTSPGSESGSPIGKGREPDPLLPALLPRIFEAEGVGRALQHEFLDPISPWLRTIRDLARSGAVERGPLLDGCVRRFLRGGDARELRFFARLHELLEPSAAEVGARRRDYLRLLPVAPGPVAELALRHVRRLDSLEAGGHPAAELGSDSGIARHRGHDVADVAEALEGVLFRPEATLARSALTWLDQTIRRFPDRADELAPALVTAFHHESYEVQSRAARLAVKHSGRFTPLGAERFRDAIPVLPPELGGPPAAAFGGAAAVPETPPPPYTPVPLPEPPVARPFPAVPVTPAEMEAHNGFSHGWEDDERWLAGFVRLAGQDGHALGEALAGRFGTSRPHLFRRRKWSTTGEWCAALARELIAPGEDPGVPGVPAEEPEPMYGGRRLYSVTFATLAQRTEDEAPGVEDDARRPEADAGHDDGDAQGVDVGDEHGGWVPIVGADGRPTGEFGRSFFSWGPLPPGPWEEPPPPEAPADRLPRPREVSAPHLFLLRRYAEILAALKAGALPPVLLATPTLSTGTLDPDVLVSRLAECEAAGAVALPADLQQALLRLPRGHHPGAASRAAGLTSEAGRTAARWMAGGGLPDPVTGARWSYYEDDNVYYTDERPPGGIGQALLVPGLTAAPTGLDLIDELLTEPPKWTEDRHGECMGWWPSVLPSHREVVAAHLLPYLLQRWYEPEVRPMHAAMLAAADGPAGPATALVLGHVMARKESGDGVLVFLTMAARGDLPAAELGARLGQLVRWASVSDKHVVDALAAAADRGAPQQVWHVLRALIPALLPGEGERPLAGLVSVLAFAVMVAERTGARGELPEVAVIAARRSASAYARECRRLHERLTRP